MSQSLLTRFYFLLGRLEWKEKDIKSHQILQAHTVRVLILLAFSFCLNNMLIHRGKNIEVYQK